MSVLWANKANCDYCGHATNPEQVVDSGDIWTSAELSFSAMPATSDFGGLGMLFDDCLSDRQDLGLGEGDGALCLFEAAEAVQSTKYNNSYTCYSRSTVRDGHCIAHQV